MPALSLRALPLALRARPLRAAARTAATTASSSPRAAMEAIKFGPDASIPGYITGPKGKPGVIMMQEWWGVNDQIKSHAAKLGAAGFRVLVPDIYKGAIGVDKEEAGHLMSNLDWAVAIEEIKAAAKHLKEVEGAPAVGITGFCMGGALSLCGARFCDDIAVAAPFYGIPQASRCDLSTLGKPVQGHFGELDGHTGFSDPASAKALEETLRKGGGETEIFMYPGNGHGFMNDTPAPYPDFEARRAAMGMVPYDAAAAELAWSRLTAFLSKHLDKNVKALL